METIRPVRQPLPPMQAMNTASPARVATLTPPVQPHSPITIAGAKPARTIRATSAARVLTYWRVEPMEVIQPVRPGLRAHL